MIELTDVVAKGNTTQETEHGSVEVPGGIFAKFVVDEVEEVLIPINGETYNAFMDLMQKDTNGVQ